MKPSVNSEASAQSVNVVSPQVTLTQQARERERNEQVVEVQLIVYGHVTLLYFQFEVSGGV